EQEGVQGAHRAGAAPPCGEALQRDRSQVRTAQGRARPGRRLHEDLSPRPAPRRRFRKGSHRARLSSKDEKTRVLTGLFCFSSVCRLLGKAKKRNFFLFLANLPHSRYGAQGAK